MTGRDRVLVIENSRQVTGALKSICAMAYDLQHDFDFVFILPSGSAATNWLRSHSQVRIVEVPMMEISRSWKVIFYIPALIISSLRIRKVIKKEKIDIVHSNDLYNLIGPFLKFFGVKFRYVCHVRFLPGGFPSWLFRFWINRQLAAADRIIAVSDFLKHQLPADAKVIRIYDRMLLTSSGQVISKRNTNTILYLSNIIPGKGHDHIIAAFAVTPKKFPSWKLRIVGSDMNLDKNRRYRETLKEMAITLGIDRAIEWSDFVDDVAVEYASADIFANFSSSESFSMTCLEAQYYGCCVVTTNSGGPAEIISDGTSGMVVPVGDVKAMADALEKVMGDQQLRESMGTYGAATVRKKFGPLNTSETLRSVYREIRDGQQSH